MDAKINAILDQCLKDLPFIKARHAYRAIYL